MKLVSGKKLEGALLFERRKQAVMLHQKGESQAEIARLVGVHRCTISRWIKAWRSGGAEFLKPKKRGVAEGVGRSLSQQQELQLISIVRGCLPHQVGVGGMLWERDSIAALIERETSMKMPRRTVGDYLMRWGMSRPKQARGNPSARRFLQAGNSSFLVRAKGAKAEVHWLQQVDIKGEAGLSMISSVANQGRFRFMIYEGCFDMEVLRGFLDRLCHDVEARPLALVLDGCFVAFQEGIEAWHDDVRLPCTWCFQPTEDSGENGVSGEE